MCAIVTESRKVGERFEKAPTATIAPRRSKGGAMVFTCERDGFVMRGETEDELAAEVERHIAEAHPDLAGKLSRDDILDEGRAKAEE
jgi:predicted small metal-binding protein